MSYCSPSYLHVYVYTQINGHRLDIPTLYDK